MAKQEFDQVTRELDLVSVTRRGPGRPCKVDALSNAERQQRFRDKKKRAKRQALYPVLYRGPNGEAWVGRGLMPKWLVMCCRNLECDKSAFLVKR